MPHNASAQDFAKLQQDNADLQAQNEKLKEALASLEEANDQKLRMITHDISGAVQVMMLALDAMEVRPNELEKNVERIRRATKRIMGIVYQIREERSVKNNLNNIE